MKSLPPPPTGIAVPSGTIEPRFRTCGACEGTGVLYQGDPADMATMECTCDRCNGRGRVPVTARGPRAF